MDAPTIFSPTTLPCGRVVPNRLVKVAMYEHLAFFSGGPPTQDHCALYSYWSQYEWGMLITGNVQVSRRHLTLGRDMVIPETISDETLQPYARLAAAMHNESSPSGLAPAHRPLAVMQLSHAGRQSPNIIGGRPLFESPSGPSPIPVGSSTDRKASSFSGAVNRLLFQIPREMSLPDVDELVEAFVRGASVAHQAGFDGVQLHVAHGYLLAQFISPKSNKRTDEYSASSANALNLLHRIVTAIRCVVPDDFILGMKINAGDYADSDPDSAHKTAKAEQENRAFEHVRAIAGWGGVDFIEVSGGDYENPEFMATEAAQSTSKSPRQALFAQFSHRALAAVSPPSTDPTARASLILLTGGLRTLSQLHSVLAIPQANLLGIGRSSVLRPDLPQLLRERERDLATDPGIGQQAFATEPVLDVATTRFRLVRWLWRWAPKVRLVGAGVDVAWYIVVMRQVAMQTLRLQKDGKKVYGSEPNHNMSGIEALLKMWFWRSTPNYSILHRMASGFVLFALIVALIMRM